MLDDVKKELLKHPEKIKEILEHFGYANVQIYHNRLQFGRSQDSSKKSIVIKTTGENLYVNDYARNINQDFFTYIMNQRGVDFITVMSEVRSVLGITDYYAYFNRKGIFGGFYDRIRNKMSGTSVRIYDDDILHEFRKCPNKRFIRDHISIKTQRMFGIMYDVESQGIVIPIRDQFGQLMGAKIRCNYEVEDGEQKYWYIIPCASSKTLYGYCQNYQYLTDGTVLVFEAEKSVLQCHSYGVRNAVALGSGSLSNTQTKMLLELHPHRVIFMHDQGFAYENIEKNMLMLQRYSRFTEIQVGYWDWTRGNYQSKVSASDLGAAELHRILKEEISYLGDVDEEI